MKKNLFASIIIVLTVIFGGSVSEISAAQTSCVYTIEYGDTLSELAKKWGTSVSMIMKANLQIKHPNRIYAGRTLVVPERKAAKSVQAENIGNLVIKANFQKQIVEKRSIGAQENILIAELNKLRAVLNARKEAEVQIAEKYASQNQRLSEKFAAAEVVKTNMRNLAVAFGFLIVLLLLAFGVFWRALTYPIKSRGINLIRGHDESTLNITFGKVPD